MANINHLLHLLTTSYQLLLIAYCFEVGIYRIQFDGCGRAGVFYSALIQNIYVLTID